MRWHKVRVIARFELVTTVRRLGYLVITLGMPLFTLLYASLALVPTYLVAQREFGEKHYGIVDESGALRLAAGQIVSVEHAKFAVYASEEQAREALLRDERVASYYVVVADYLHTGIVHGYTRGRAAIGPWDGRDDLAKLVRERLVSASLSPEAAERVVTPLPQRRAFRVESDGARVAEPREAAFGRLVLPVGFVFLLFTSVLMSGGYLLSAMATEKENKVVDVLLSAASSDEIMAGKLVGLGGAGLLQVTVWLLMTLAVRGLLMRWLLPFDVRVPWQALVISPVLFLAAYAFLGSLMLGTGSLGTNVRESHQLGMIWALLGTIPLVFLPVILGEPHGAIARVLTWLPLSAPATLVFRLSLDASGVALWEVCGAILLLLLSTVLAVRVSARLFRIGLLLGPTRPPLRALWRQTRSLR